MIDYLSLEYLKNKKISTDKRLGYQYVYDVNHPLASNGKVWLHRHIISVKLKRWILSNEHVHHIDGNKTNNSLSNLMLLSPSEHSKLEGEKRKAPKRICSVCGVIELSKGNKSGKCFSCFIRTRISTVINKIKRNRRLREKDSFCSNCSLPIINNTKTGLCRTCLQIERRKFNPSKEELEKLVWKFPTVKVAKMFDVTDKAIDKRCKFFKIKKPPRGYWRKKSCGKI